MKNTEKVLSPASTRVYCVFLPRRASVNDAKVRRISAVMSAKLKTLGPKGTLKIRIPGKGGQEQ